jgi:hypothetical protein
MTSWDDLKALKKAPVYYFVFDKSWHIVFEKDIAKLYEGQTYYCFIRISV